MAWAIDFVFQDLRTSAIKKEWKKTFELIVLHDMGYWLVLEELRTSSKT